ncbi:IclR family transcriptional regulator [Mesobacterium pallidum]|uniref:IclR family transcriptional regulator n=1 Tax=Mesobacterium pallidum TaxID=2872037 RepID=UPI001EE38B3A|nr:IclR family transcriptional regulator [Mesobacterium pallidum]
MRKRKSDAAEDDRQFITSLARGLDVLRAFRPTDSAGLSNRELGDRTGLPNSTVSRLTYTLLQLGYLVYDEGTGRYRLGAPVLGLGYACLGGMKIVETAQVYMQRLADECGEGVTVALGGRDDRAMTYVAAARSPGLVALTLNVGSRISLARSSMGRAYLAAMEPERRETVLKMLAEHYGPEKWAEVLPGIEDAQRQIRTRGFYLNAGDWHAGVNSVGVPFRSPRPDTPLLAFNIGAPSYFLPRDELERKWGPRLMDMVRMIGRVG